MLKKVLKEIILFIFDIGLILYFLLYCLFDFFIEVFMGTNITKGLFFTIKNIDKLIETIGTFIIENLKNMDLWD